MASGTLGQVIAGRETCMYLLIILHINLKICILVSELVSRFSSWKEISQVEITHLKSFYFYYLFTFV